jgi:hypothetical protein
MGAGLGHYHAPLLPLLKASPRRAQVAIHSAQLFTLTDTHDGSPAVPLGAIAFADLHVTYHSTRRGNMFVKVRVDARSAAVARARRSLLL